VGWCDTVVTVMSVRATRVLEVNRNGGEQFLSCSGCVKRWCWDCKM